MQTYTKNQFQNILNKYYFCAVKKTLSTILLAFACLCASAQITELWQKYAVADDFEIDKLNNIYLIKDNVVSKYDEGMNFVCSYDNYSAGGISLVDVVNPFKIIVFYSEFNKLIYLDNKLSELRSPIFLDDAGFYNVMAVCSSSFGGFWIFDEQNVCVRRIETDLTTSQQGTNLYEKIGDANITSICESGNYIFLFADNGRILVLDKFGNFYLTVENDNECSDFCIDNDILYCNYSEGIKVFDVSTQKSGQIQIGEKPEHFCVKHDKLYVLKNSKLVCSKIQFEK